MNEVYLILIDEHQNFYSNLDELLKVCYDFNDAIQWLKMAYFPIINPKLEIFITQINYPKGFPDKVAKYSVEGFFVWNDITDEWELANQYMENN